LRSGAVDARFPGKRQEGTEVGCGRIACEGTDFAAGLNLALQAVLDAATFTSFDRLCHR
jgi:hypothetical protein